MGLGSDFVAEAEKQVIQALPASDKPLTDVNLGASVVWLAGFITGSKTLKSVGMGAMGAVWMVRLMMKARAQKGAPAPTESLQGW